MPFGVPGISGVGAVSVGGAVVASRLQLRPDGNGLLFIDNHLVYDDECCCGCGCTCVELQDRWHAGHKLKLTISGAIVWGPCLWPVLGAMPELCDTGWGPWPPDECLPAIEECQGMNLHGVWLYCPTEDGTSLQDVVCEAALSNMGCNFTAGNRTPFMGGEQARTPTEIICDPLATPSFYAKYVFPLAATALGGCVGCPEPWEVVFEWESYGPLP